MTISRSDSSARPLLVPLAGHTMGVDGEPPHGKLESGFSRR
jgi:hypothetical protein